MNKLGARGLNRYIDLKKEKQQQKIEEAELIENNRHDKRPKANSLTDQGNDQAKSTNQAVLDPDTQKAIKKLQEGDALTRADIRMLSHLLLRPIRFFDESGQPLGEEIGGYKSGEPIPLGIIRDKNKGIDHIVPLNLRPAQRAQYESLDQTKNNCALNAFFVYLPKEKTPLCVQPPPTDAGYT